MEGQSLLKWVQVEISQPWLLQICHSWLRERRPTEILYLSPTGGAGHASSPSDERVWSVIDAEQIIPSLFVPRKKVTGELRDFPMFFAC